MSVAQIAKSLQHILEEEAVGVAKETGFTLRERVLTGADFAQALALILGWLQRPDERLEGLVQIIADVSAPPLSFIHPNETRS